jgi:CDP-glucose 4,6-dehydratase
MSTFWKDKTVFVTGHTGFKGAWLCSWLSIRGAKVYGYSLPPTSSIDLYNLLFGVNELAGEFSEIRDFSALKSSLQQFSPEVIFHLAAQPLVRQSYRDPIDTFSTNIIGTVNLLEAVRGIESVKAIVNVTTDKCYKNNEWHWGYREVEPMGGHDPYSASKACSELITSSYISSYFGMSGIGLASARAGNVIGGGDWAEDRLIPDLIRGLNSNTKVQIRNPS